MKRKSIMWMLSGLCMIAMLPLTGCDNDVSNDETYGLNIDCDIEICVKDTSGNDLLSPDCQSDKAIKEMNLYQIYKGDTIFIAHFGATDDFIWQYNDAYTNAYGETPCKNYIKLSGGLFKYSINYPEEKSMTRIIEWSNGTKDALTSEFEVKEGLEIVSKVFLNDSLVFDGYIKNPIRRVVIVK